jgi:hypothetical protein
MLLVRWSAAVIAGAVAGTIAACGSSSSTGASSSSDGGSGSTSGSSSASGTGATSSNSSSSGSSSGGASTSGGHGGGDAAVDAAEAGTAPESGSDAESVASRPGYSTGDGFFVLGGKLYDPNGHEFRIRGVNRNHYDSSSQPALSHSGANTVRTFVETNYGQTWAGLANIIQTDNVAYKEVPVITAPGTTTGTGTSCNVDASLLTDVVMNSWVTPAATWTAFNKNGIFNIANEWGPSNSTTWRDAYITAISQMRAAGYLGPLMIDAGGCGQDEADLEQYAQAVFASDPQRNIIFSYHAYGGTGDTSASITGIQRGNPTVVSIAGSGMCHPFAPGYCPSSGMTNSFSGVTNYFISGAQGTTQINGKQPAPTNVGGTSGAWTVTLSVDSSSWGAYTSGGTIVDYDSNYTLKFARLGALAKSTGAAFVIGEFGPGRDIGPSPTMVTPQEIIGAAEANDLGWMAWAWDDHDQSSGSDNQWFGLAYQSSTYGASSDLTIFGQQVVEGCTNAAPGGCGCPDNPPPALTAVTPGCKGTPAPAYSGLSLKQLAQPATSF